MQETISLLNAIDTRLRRHSLQSTPKYKKNPKFPYAKVLEFSEDKFGDYPKFLTQRDDFLNFMYGKYEAKLLSIPKICEKQDKESDEKYFVSLYLEQIPIFSGLPQLVKDILLNSVRTKYFQPGSTIHSEDHPMEFMAVIFVGAVSFTDRGKRVTKIKNDVIMTQAFYGSEHPSIVAKEETVLLTFPRGCYEEIQTKLFKDIEDKSRDEIADLIKSDFFIELHLKDRKARNFFDLLRPEFYFKGEHICDAGELPKKFYIIFRGEVREQNQIYIREHNKWPLPNRRWEVRAVYNSFENSDLIKSYSFFGDEEIINALRLKSTYIASSHVILFSMDKDTFIDSLSTEDFKRLKKYRNEHININYGDFEKSVREKVKSMHERRKIVHKAIDTSFMHRSNFPTRKISLVHSLEKKMLSDSMR